MEQITMREQRLEELVTTFLPSPIHAKRQTIRSMPMRRI